MKPVQSSIADLLFPENTCFQIPPFQRNYQWGTTEIQNLIKDIRAAVFGEPKHWIGVALVGSSEIGCALSNYLSHSCKEVLDGQQRLITLRLWCTALIDEYVRQCNKEPTVQLSDGKKALFNREGFTNISVHSLDIDSWKKVQNAQILKEKQFSTGSQSAITQTYQYFRYVLLVGMSALTSEDPYKVPENKNEDVTLLESWLSDEAVAPISPQDIQELLKSTVEKLSVTVLEHESEDEDIEEIFETLNSSRVELGQFDLFRNYLLINSKTKGKAQGSLYTKHLASAEKSINSAVLNLKKSRPLDRFLYDFLIGLAVSAETIKAGATAREFKIFWETLDEDRKDVKTFLDETLTPSMSAWLTAFSAGHVKKGSVSFEDEDLAEDIHRVLMRIENLSRGPFVPLTTRLILDNGMGNDKNLQILLDKLKLVEVFVARSLLAGDAFSPLRRTIMSACVQIFQKHELTLEEWVRENSPTDERIISVLTQSVAREVAGHAEEPDPSQWIFQNDFYSRADSRQIRAIFDGIVHHQEGQLAARLIHPPTRKVTKKSAIWIEHLFPQNETEWVADLAKWRTPIELMKNRLDAIGNIAVLPMDVNIKLSNNPLEKKIIGLKELKVPNWKMLETFLGATQWTNEEIDSRTMSLTKTCLEIWKLP